MDAEIKMNRQMWVGLSTVGFAVVALSPLAVGAVDAAEKLTIGAVESVTLHPWKITLPARIDTGATTSSLDAREITVRDKRVVFTLADKYGGLELQMPLVEWRKIRTSEGAERRPVVEVELCLGSKQFRTQVTLNDRSRVKYPFIVGRRALQGRFLVDVSRSNILPPSCPEARSQ